MGIVIKRNNKGLYKLTCTISNEKYFGGKWVTEEKVKALLIERRIWRFLEEIGEIEMEFPTGYHVNGMYEKNPSLDLLYKETWLKKSKDSKELSKFIFENATNAIKKHKLENFLKPLIKK